MDPTILKVLFDGALRGIGAFASRLRKRFTRRKRSSRGGQERRRTSRDRRVRGLEHRLRYGIWLHFHLKTALGQSQVLTLNTQHTNQLYEAGIVEAERYEFADRGTGALLPSSAAVKSVLELACGDWISLPRKQQQAFALTGALANRLTSSFNVRMRDRRLQQRRASA